MISEETRINVEEELKKLSKEAERISLISDFTEFFECLKRLLNDIDNKEKYENLINDVILKLIYNDYISFYFLLEFYNILKNHNLEKSYENIIAIRLAKLFPRYKNITNEDMEILEIDLKNLTSSSRELSEKFVKVFVPMVIYDAINTVYNWIRNPNKNQEVSYFLTIVKILKELELHDYAKDGIELFKNTLKLHEPKIEKLIKRRMKNENLKRETATLIEILEDRRFYKYLL